MLTSFSTICEKYEAVLHDYIAYVVSFVVVPEASMGKEAWEYVVALDSLLGLRVREYLLPVPCLQVLLFLSPVLGLEEICETNTKKLFSSSNYF